MGPPTRVRRALRKAWPATRIVIGFALVVVAVWALSSKTSELNGFSTIFRHFDWWWVGPAVVAEIASYFCFAAMQFELLRAGHLRPPWRPLVKLTFASQAITNSLPIGNAVSSVYGFRWFRRFGADNTLAVWALAGTLVAAVVSLSLVAILGLGVAAQEGASLDLVPVLIGTFLVTLGIGSLFVYEKPLHAVLSVGPQAVGGAHPPAPGRHRRDDRPHHRLDDRRAPQLDPDRAHHHLGRRQLAARLRLLRHDVRWRSGRRSRGKVCCWPTEPGSWRRRCPSRPAASASSRAPSRSRWWRSGGPRPARPMPCCSTAS